MTDQEHLNMSPQACRGLNRLPIIQSVGDGRDGGHGRGRRPRGRHSHVVSSLVHSLFILF